MEQLQPQPHDEASFNAMESFRFYENDFPETDEIVMVRVDRLTETFAYVQLLEYNNLEGIIQFSELSKTRLKSPLKFLKVGKQDEMQVLRVDEEKGYVDLTMKHLNKADEEECQERFRQSKAVDSILRHISVTHRQPLEMLYRNIAWPLARNEKYSHPLEALKSSIKEDTSVLDELQLDPDIKKELLRVITRRFQKIISKLKLKLKLHALEEMELKELFQLFKQPSLLQQWRLMLKFQLLVLLFIFWKHLANPKRMVSLH